MSLRESLPLVLRGELAGELDASALDQLDDLAQAAAQTSQLASVRDECASRLRQGGASHGVEYLLAAVCIRNGEMERALQTLLALGDRLATEKRWGILAIIADRTLVLEETQAGARLLVKAHEAMKKDPARIEALERAFGIIPDDLDLGLLLAVRLGEAGRGDERRTMLGELLPRFAAEKRWPGLEECALEFVEHQDHEGLLRLVATLPEVADQGAQAECQQQLDIAFPPLLAAGRAGECEKGLRGVIAVTLTRAGEAAVERYRTAMLECLKQGKGSALPDLDPVIERSGLGNPEIPLATALERFDAIADLPPGRAVHHANFGAGRIATNDAETVAIDFAHARGHRMPIAAARRTLTSIPDDDLRLMRVMEPQALDALRKDVPGDIVVRALGALGGEADAQKLKVFLVGSQIVPAKDWTTFWRKARAAAEEDSRIDHARAFEQFYRLTPQGAAGAGDRGPLPGLQPRKPVKHNLSVIRKFLVQHPGAEQALTQRFGKYIARAVRDPDGDIVDRARAGLYFARWFPERTAEWMGVLQSLWEHGLSVTDLSGEDEQLALLHVSHQVGVEADAILSGLDSRYSAVRAEAAQLRQMLDAAGSMALNETLLKHAPRYPLAALRLLEEELAVSTPRFDGWRMLLSALTLIEDRPKPSTAEKIQRWLAPGGAFLKLLGGRDCPDDSRLRLRVLLRQWRSSDRFLFPALEAIERLGLADVVEAVRSDRQQKADRLFDGVGKQAEDADIAVMTRATWERLKTELDRMERELKTTIPATIQRARELGDLKENAEYHSAKLKQANVSKLVATLQLRLTRARFVDELEYRDGTVGIGTEVVLESPDEVVTYWILGDEEHHHGANVVSFQAPIGRALVGHSIGDNVEIGEGGERKAFRVVSVERRLPQHEGKSTS